MFLFGYVGLTLHPSAFLYYHTGRRALRPYATFTVIWRLYETLGLVLAIFDQLGDLNKAWAPLYDVPFLIIQIIGA